MHVNRDAKLVRDLFGTLALRPTRDGFGEGLVLAGKKDENLVVLCADLTESTRVETFKQAFPERFVQMGVSEQSLAAIAAGMALAARMYYGNQPTFWIYALLSDGELDEGNSWEAVMLASKYRLDNLIAIVDRNNVQIEGNTEDVMPLESLSAKWAAFGWHVLEIDGHNFESIVGAVEEAKARRNRPTVIIAHTIPGKGVKEFERDYHWHGKSPNREQADMALKELRTLGGKIRSEHE